MKRRSLTVLTLSLAFAVSGALHSLRAQQANRGVPQSEPPSQQRCVQWMTATVPSIDGLSPADFCGGVKADNRGVGGWNVAFECGQSQITGAPGNEHPEARAGYCASSGQWMPGEAWAAGYHSTTRDGHDLLHPNPTKDAPPSAATFYSHTDIWISGLRLPAGMYQLTPSRSPGGWKLAVAKFPGDTHDTGRPALGSVTMQNAASDGTGNGSGGKHNLAISTSPQSKACAAAAGRVPRSDPAPNPASYKDFRELHFMDGSEDLYVCVRPEQLLSQK